MISGAIASKTGLPRTRRRLEGAEELVAAAVAAADRAQPRVALAVLLHPAEVADQAGPGGVRRCPRRSGSRRARSRRTRPSRAGRRRARRSPASRNSRTPLGLVVREPPQPWLCISSGTGCFEAGAGRAGTACSRSGPWPCCPARGRSSRSRWRRATFAARRGRAVRRSAAAATSGGAEQGDQAGSHAGTTARRPPEVTRGSPAAARAEAGQAVEVAGAVAGAGDAVGVHDLAAVVDVGEPDQVAELVEQHRELDASRRPWWRRACRRSRRRGPPCR